jgi:hypothetical protein
VALLQLHKLLELVLAHDGTLLVEPFDLTAENNDLEGELVGEGLFLL